MRDVLLFLIVIGTIPFILRRTWIGVIVWSWLGYMNPHRLTWGFSYFFPFAQLVAIVTFVSLLFDRGPKRLPTNLLMGVWIAFILWLNVTTLFAMVPGEAAYEWERTMKIMIFAVLTVALIDTRKKLEILLWTIVLSLAFYGVKGGVFALVRSGEDLVFGPPGSFFGENNSLALVLIMTLPLLYYLQLSVHRRWMKLALFAAIGLTGLSVLASHSRGALLGAAAMVAMLWLRSRHKVKIGLVMLLLIPPMLFFMPAEWWERMATIRNFQEDASAMGRINAWGFAVNIANERPLIGGGFRVFDRALFMRYAPNPLSFHDAHSIYFEVLGEHGYVGLLLFLALGLLTLLMGSRILRRTRDVPELVWARDLASMLQVSLAGYAVSGAFLGLAYFDLYYSLIAIMLITNRLVEEHLAQRVAEPHVASAQRPATLPGAVVGPAVAEGAVPNRASPSPRAAVAGRAPRGEPLAPR